MSFDLDRADGTETLYDAILEDISSGRLVGGQRLKVSELAKRFGVSASPVRETLRQMQGEGFVEIHANRGALVKRADASTIQNIFEVLRLLEPYLVTWFAEFAAPEAVAELQEIQDRMVAAAKSDTALLRRLDTRFHGTICRHHYNPVAAENWQKLRTALNVHAAPLRITPTRVQKILAEHAALIAAFQAGDATRADTVIRSHIDGSFINMSQQMRALGL